MLLLAVLVTWVLASLFAVVLCAAARRGDQELVRVRSAALDAAAEPVRRFRAS